MLSRGFSRDGAPERRKRGRRLFGTAILTVGLTVMYFLLPEAGPRLKPVALSDGELRGATAGFAAKLPRPADGDHARAQVALGRKLFRDAALSANGQVSCATCHAAAQAFTDGKPVSVGLAPGTKNAPTVINTYMNTWFFADGRADSLAAQALKPLEDPGEQGFTRVGLARALAGRYRDDYVKAFGELPAELKGVSLPEKGLPAPAPLKLTIETAAASLATLGSFSLLSEVLGAAQTSRTAPAMELSRRTFAGAAPDPAAIKAYEALSPAVKGAVDQVFANAGRAIAAFEGGIAAVESPFDHFAARVVALSGDQPIAAALDGQFGATELAGLKIFVGPGRCVLCHAGANFTDQQFHNTGLGQRGGDVDVGRTAGIVRLLADPFNCVNQGGKIPPDADKESCRELPFLDGANPELIGAFKTPGLRNVAQTAPYMHDGRFSTLSAAIEHYDQLPGKPATGHREESLKPLDMTDEEKEALVAFLSALTSPVRDVNAEQTVSVK